MPTQAPRPRIRKQRARARANSSLSTTAPTSADSNATEILPVSASEREARRQKLREELRAAKPESKSSSKKRKRLDKYIDTKLRRDESADLIKKLSAQESFDTSLLRSSKKLGRGDETKRELLGRTLREQRAGLGRDEDRDILLEERHRAPESLPRPTAAVTEPTQRLPPKTAVAEAGAKEQVAAGPESEPRPLNGDNGKQSPGKFGSGLKRPLQVDESGQPMIQKRKKVKTDIKWAPPPTVDPSPTAESEEDWEGFSSASDKEDMMSENASGDENAEESAGDEDDTSGSEEEESTSDTSVDDQETSGAESLEGGTAEKVAARKERLGAFRAWANQQRNEALGFQSSNALDSVPQRSFEETAQKMSNGSAPEMSNAPAHNRPRAIDSVLPKVSELSSAAPVYHVSVQRTPDIEEARSALPVVAEEQRIMEAIRSNDTVIICGSTGSGKTTQVPQFLFEAGYGDPKGPTPGLIGITQPRRVAAVSMAKRVATELGEHVSRVAHQIRFDSTVGKNTSMKFMTDGILLREVGQDFTLSKYSVIVLDEAHERSVNTDILIGMLSRIVETRVDLSRRSSKYQPLKLVIMSATLKTVDLLDNQTLFRKGIPPVVEAEGRQYPVTVHFARKTERDYLDQAFLRISRGHRKLPPGAILVFLTGQNEIQQLAKRLQETFQSTDGGHRSGKVRVSAADTTVEDEDIEFGRGQKRDAGDESDSDADIRGLDNDDDDDEEFQIEDGIQTIQKIHVLPLYSQLPTEQQMRVFEPPPAGSRMIVLATNIAETSLTIPGVRYVFDCGRAKEKQYDQLTGVQSFDMNWVSKASASQRTGRAGRTGPGHCYRLYSSAVYERDFPEFAEPEVVRAPVEGVVLQLKSMGIPNVANFPFPSPPDRTSLLKAERLLEYLGAIEDGKVTALGRQLSLYPLSPRLGRMLCIAQKHKIADQAISLVAALTAGDVFIPESQLDIREVAAKEDEDWTEADNNEAALREIKRKEYNSFHGSVARLDRISDGLKLLTTLHDFVTSPSDSFRAFARIKALNEALQLRHQLAVILTTNDPTLNLSSRIPTTELSKTGIKLLRQIIASGFIDRIAQRADLSPTPPTTTSSRTNKPKRATEVPYLTLFPSHDPASNSTSSSMTTIDTDDPENLARQKHVYIHPSSVLAHTSPQKLPQYLIYSHLSHPAPSTINSQRLPRTRMHPLTPISVAQIITLTQNTPLLEEGKPIGRIESLERDRDGRERRACWTVPFLVPGMESGGGVGWPLPPARRVLQRREGARGWVVESVVGEGV